MPYSIEHWGKDKGIVVNTSSGKHFSETPIPLTRAKKQMRLLYALEEGNLTEKDLNRNKNGKAGSR